VYFFFSFVLDWPTKNNPLQTKSHIQLLSRRMWFGHVVAWFERRTDGEDEHRALVASSLLYKKFPSSVESSSPSAEEVEAGGVGLGGAGLSAGLRGALDGFL